MDARGIEQINTPMKVDTAERAVLDNKKLEIARQTQTDSILASFERHYPGIFDAEFRFNVHCSAEVKGRLASTCRLFNILFKPELKRLKPLAIHKLLTHVIRGEQAEAEKMIQRYPYLLLETGVVEDYAGRIIQGTALQLALGAEDVKYHDDEECMVEMIQKYLKQLPKGEVIIAEQTAKQFPVGWQVKEEERAKCDSGMLNEVINTIANSSSPAEWENEIYRLECYLKLKNKLKLFQTGKHFNHQLLVEALDLYNQHYMRFGGFNGRRNNIVWRNVIGTIERYVTASTAQALCTGVATIVEMKGKLKRTLSLYNYHSAKRISYFPLNADSGSILGLDFAVYSYYGWGVAGRAVCAWEPIDFCAQFMANKNIKLAALTQRPQPERPTQWCVIS